MATTPTAKPSTFIQEKRRQQLVDATITVLAETGVAGATFVAIAARAGVSRGVINYHFADRAALLDAVVVHIYSLGRDEVESSVRSASSPAAAIRAMITGSIAFYARHIHERIALSAIYRSDDVDTVGRGDRGEHSAEMAKLTAILRRGQRAREFRRFDVDVMAASIRAVLDSAIGQLAGGADPARLGREIGNLFDAATRSETP
ncbi:TetR family transcriptional regulator [Williamsia herbipolensis]|uniref:TetR family transcriptional regulator n=1 Tax=Williamsia herbipolensis TaxID=1603258 RepID=A0AAU4K1I0_9NOCA|nr:TetR family transcriptional regulator [Williamsia herbipolensis]